MPGWDELEDSPNTDVRDVTQATEDINKLCLRVLGSEDGQKLLQWLRDALIEQPVAVPGADPSFAFYREGQNSVVRDLEARISKARRY
jgi:hypothetical protein